MAGLAPGLSDRARAEIEAQAHACWFSVCSIWEIAIKGALGRPDFKVDPVRLRRGLLEGGAQELTITSAHALATADLPPIHKDPFDRLLIAQAHVEGLTLLTSDAAVGQYGGRVRKV
jgi:PIN domain nuclease of toxin-antitoxin system